MAVAGEVGGIAIIHVAVAATGVETAVQARQVGGLADPDLGRLGLGIGPGEAGLRVVAEDPLDGFLQAQLGRWRPAAAGQTAAAEVVDRLAGDLAGGAEHVRLVGGGAGNQAEQAAQQAGEGTHQACSRAAAA